MKRANGTGSVVRLSGKRRRPYAIRVSTKNAYGMIVQHTVSYHATAREAQAALEQYLQSLAAGKAPKPDLLSTTVRQVFDAWSAKEYPKIKPQSVKSHNAAWNQRVSRFADLKIRDVTLDQWQSILDEGEDEGRSKSTISNDAILIRALCAYAMKRDILGKDYSQYLEIPTVGPKMEKDSLNDLQIAKLEQMVKDGVPWADTVLILCYTGFRISEFLELTRFSYHPEHGGYLIGGMKTEAGRERIVPIHPKIAPYLKRHLAEDGETIICRNRKSISSSWYRDHAFSPIVTALGIPQATPHWCRHTFATKLHKAEVDELVIKWLMGHSTKKDVTAGYIHRSIETLKENIHRIA